MVSISKPSFFAHPQEQLSICSSFMRLQQSCHFFRLHFLSQFSCYFHHLCSYFLHLCLKLSKSFRKIGVNLFQTLVHVDFFFFTFTKESPKFLMASRIVNTFQKAFLFILPRIHQGNHYLQHL